MSVVFSENKHEITKDGIVADAPILYPENLRSEIDTLNEILFNEVISSLKMQIKNLSLPLISKLRNSNLTGL